MQEDRGIKRVEERVREKDRDREREKESKHCNAFGESLFFLKEKYRKFYYIFANSFVFMFNLTWGKMCIIKKIHTKFLSVFSTDNQLQKTGPQIYIMRNK